MRKLITGIAVLGIALLFSAWHASGADAKKPAEKKIEPEAVKLGRPVEFEKDILPILEENCIACHNQGIPESKLSVEEVADILKGGKRGAAVVPKDPEKSLLYQVVSRGKQPAMPPLPNKVQARALTPKELGLLRQWILEGAVQSGQRRQDMVNWQPLPEGINAIYSAAVSPWAEFAAAGRANQIQVYDIGAGKEISRLVDPSLTPIQFDGKPMYPKGAAHRDFVHSLAFSPDGTLLASGGYRVVKLWRRPQNVQKFQFATSAAVTALAVTADGKWAAVGAADNSIKLWNLTDGKPGATLAGHTAAVSGLAFSLDGTKLVSGSQDKTVRVWNAADGKPIAQLETPAPINAVSFNKDAAQVVTGHSDNLIRIWATPAPPAADKKPADDKKPEPPKPVRELKGHGKPVTSIALILPAATQIISGSEDATARVWDLNNGKQIRSLSHGGPVTAVAVRPDGKALASASSNGSAKLWDMNGKQLAEMKGDINKQRQVLTRTDDQTVSKQKVALADAAVKEAEKNEKDRTDAAKKATDAKTAADKAVTEADKKAKDAATKVAEAAKAVETTATAVKTSITAREAAVKKAVADAEALKKAVAAKATAQKVVTQTAEVVKKATTAKAAADKLATDTAAAAKTAAEKLAAAKKAAADKPDDKVLADAAKAAEKVAADAATAAKNAAAAKTTADKQLTDAQSAAKKATDATTAAEKARVAADAANKAAAQAKTKAEADVKTAEANAKKATDAKAAADKASTPLQADLKKKQDSQKSSVRSLQLANKAVESAKKRHTDSKAHKTAQEGIQKKIDADVAAAQKTSNESTKPLKAITFSADGSKLVTAGDDQIVRIWNAKTGQAAESLVGHKAGVVALAGAAGDLIVSAASDKAISVWDVNPAWSLAGQLGTTKEAPLDINASPFIGRILAMNFSHDGKLLAVGGGDPSRSGELTIWDVQKQTLIREIKDAHSDTVFGLEFSRDDQRLLSGAADKFVKMFEVATGKHLKSFEGHTHHVLDVSWKADGSSVASAGADNAIKVWNVETGEQRRTIGGYSKQVTSIAYIGVGDNLISCGGDKSVRFHTASNGRNYRSFSGGTDFMYSAASSRDEKVVVAGGEDGVFRIWNGADGKVISTFEPPKPAAETTQANAGK